MAEITPDSSLAEVIDSLDLASVPEKLHCSTCHGFLLNAYKTSCCEQNVCEHCFAQITDHCLMCKHKPFSKELCRPAKAMRNTVKAYLRNVEKTLADERAKSQTDQQSAAGSERTRRDEIMDAQIEANNEVENGVSEVPPTQSEEPVQELKRHAADIQPSVEVDESPADQTNNNNNLEQPPTTDDNARRSGSVESDANDDEIEIQVEPSAEDVMLETPQMYEVEEAEQSYDNMTQERSKHSDTSVHDMSNGMDPNGFNMQNMNMMGFNGMGMDMNMMQQMMNMNQMMSMGMPSMFGGFGGSNGNMNGMNMMGMNFNSNQLINGWNSQSSNMWQNNNAMNAMGGDFGFPFGSNVPAQQGNFYSQQFSNGDFNGYNGRSGRGRFRGNRASYGRGRGNFNQYQQNFGYQNAHEQQQQQHQQQHEFRNSQSQLAQNISAQSENAADRTNHKEDESHDQDDFAPGGQDEVQEALGHDDVDSTEKTNGLDSNEHKTESRETGVTQPEQPATAEDIVTPNVSVTDKIIPEAYHEDFESMAPPSAPTGPSGRYSDKEFAFRARGHGKYSSRGRGSLSASAGFPASPIRSVPQSSIAAPSPSTQGVGVAGAPTGPRAMREPSVSKAVPRPAANSGGFQIMGRASMQSQPSQSKGDERRRSTSPPNNYNDHEDDRLSSRRHSKHDRYADRGNETDSDSNHVYDRGERNHDRRAKRSDRADLRADHEMQDIDQDDASTEHRSSHRSSRHEKDRSRKDEKYSTDSRHRSSRRHYDDEDESDYEKDNSGGSVNDRHRSSRSGKSSSKHDGGRDRDRDAHRDRRRDRERDYDRAKDERHRKRSRHDRDRDNEYEYEEQDEDESRHRSRRHKKEHHAFNRRDRDTEVDETDLGLRISGRSNSNHPSALPTPTSVSSVSFANLDKDPHTLEREARNQERMRKEQQRREKAALDKKGTSGNKSGRTTTSGGRRVSYKYEDEVERGMGVVDEREKARWR